MSVFYMPMLLMKKKPSNPVVKKQYIALPDIEHFDIEQQSTIDTCGLCAAEMVMNTILNQKKVTEDDIIKSQITPNIPLFKKTVGIFPSQLQFGIQEVIDQYALPYTATLRHLLSYREIKNILKQGSYMIFSHMGDAIDNPYRKIHGTKNLSLKDIHNPHYIVLLAIDEPRQEVIVANPFGYTQTLPFKEFWERISLDPKYVHAHSIYSLLIESGLYIPRSCVIVSKNP